MWSIQQPAIAPAIEFVQLGTAILSLAAAGLALVQRIHSLRKRRDDEPGADEPDADKADADKADEPDAGKADRGEADEDDEDEDEDDDG